MKWLSIVLGTAALFAARDIPEWGMLLGAILLGLALFAAELRGERDRDRR